MTASFNTSFFSTPDTAASGVSKKVSALPHTIIMWSMWWTSRMKFTLFEVEAVSASEASEQAADMAMSVGVQGQLLSVRNLC